MKIHHIDRTWNLEKGTPTQHYADYFCENAQDYTGLARGEGPYHGEPLNPEDKFFGVILPWKGAQWPKYVEAMKTLFRKYVERKAKVVIFADDLHHLLWAFPHARDTGLLDLNPMVVSNFQDISSVWPVSTPRFFWPIYPFHRIKPVQLLRDIDFGYVGRWNPRRYSILKDAMPAAGVLLGPQWYKQDRFKFIDHPLHWLDLGKYYRRMKSGLSVQDGVQAAMRPRISRIGESAQFLTPIFLHKSHIPGIEFPIPGELLVESSEDYAARAAEVNLDMCAWDQYWQAFDKFKAKYYAAESAERYIKWSLQ